MSTTQDFNRLGEEIAQAYEHRRLLKEKMQRDFSEIKKGTAELIGSLSENRAEMGHTLRVGLQQFTTDLGSQGDKRREGAMEETRQRMAEIEALRADMRQMEAETRSFLEGLESAHRAMGESLKSELAEFSATFGSQAREAMDNRVEEVETRRGDVAVMRGEIRSFIGGLNKTRAAMESARKSGMRAFEEDRKAGVQDFLDTVRTEHQEMAAAWQGVLAKITSVLERHSTTPSQGGTARQETGTQADGAGASPAAAQGDSGDVSRLKAEIAGTLKGHPDGLKMTQVAEILGIAQWRMLIPIMRDLQDTGMIRKKGALYFSE
ncbi:hypothetical protein [Desulfoluna spongiiphila]|uniref:hypothetical protein n=1 Tax=Desulfoluna spongiiphila TaxID=419481 RepID=UPI0012571819|nr:hypothetical protein [Desulfoluna spongiiphila]VVS92314.1 consensus disorder prediction [Desulfoluna spongiiphila]